MKSKILLVVGIILGVIALLLGGLYVGAIHWARKNAAARLPPEIWAQYDDFVQKPLHFDPQIIYPDPFQPETVLAARAFLEEFEKARKEIGELDQKFDERRHFLETGKTYLYVNSGTNPIPEISAEDLETSPSLLFDENIGANSRPAESPKKTTAPVVPTARELGEMAEPLRPVLDAWIRMAAMPDYDMDALAVCVEPEKQFGLPYANFGAVRSTQVLARILMDWDIERGRAEAAMDLAEAVSKGARAHTHSYMRQKLISIAGVKRIIPSWLDAVEQCADPERIRRTLRAQDALRLPLDYITTGTAELVRDSLGNVRIASRAGFRYDIQGLTGWNLYCKCDFDLPDRYVENVVLPLLNEPERSRRKAQIEGASLFSSGWEEAIDNLYSKDFPVLVVKPIVSPFIFSMELSSFEEIMTRFREAVAQIDLLRVHTASRIFELEKGRRPGSIEELVPDYLEGVPRDPFRSDGGPLSWLNGVPYSWGPDGADDAARGRYDSNNAMSSVGDIYLRPVHAKSEAETPPGEGAAPE